MIRVAKKGTKIIVVDETEQLAKRTYEKIPLVGSSFKNREMINIPVELVPHGKQDIQVKEICDGLMYCLSFRIPNE